MKAILCVAALALLTASCEACAVGSLAGVSIIDRDTGEVLPTHYSRGEYWVAGRPGSRYAVQLRNRAGGRILAVTSVDGVNVVSGATAGWDQAGYVLSGGESYQVTGWRKSDSEVAAFTFTALPDSYAARTGRPANVGVIGVALFRERVPEPPPCCAEGNMARAQAGASAAEDSLLAGAEARREAGSAVAASPAPSMKLGTGHGPREGSYVQETRFERLQSEPNEVIRIRYDSLENLVAMGIVRRPRPPVPGADPFPRSASQQFVPDPPG
jgi:hypothetical protein